MPAHSQFDLFRERRFAPPMPPDAVTPETLQAQVAALRGDWR